MYRTAAALAALLCAALLAGCGGERDRTAADIATAATKDDVNYLTPPRILGVSAGQGGYVIRGLASPDGRIRAVSGGGRAFGATADKDGRFVLLTPRPPGPVLLTIAQERAGQATKAEGLLFVPSDGPAHAVILRAGAPALPLNPQAGLIATADYDAGGGATVGGMALPGQMVQVSLDGAAVIEAKADAHGAYGARLSGEGRIAPGDHTIKVVSGHATAERHLTFTAPSAQAAGVAREPEGWRVVWPIPAASNLGQGLQSTFVVAPEERS